jgi:hypothetical protein
MYGAFVTPPDDAWADIGVVFFHNEGYSTAWRARDDRCV